MGFSFSYEQTDTDDDNIIVHGHSQCCHGGACHTEKHENIALIVEPTGDNPMLHIPQAIGFDVVQKIVNDWDKTKVELGLAG